MAGFEDLIDTLDQALFAVPTQTSAGDRGSLLALQNIVRTIVPHYVYLEAGSHLGGTLLPHLLDPRCKHVISVDPRPASQLDERGVVFDYAGNSTQRMLDTLAEHVPVGALLKLTTHDADLSELAPGPVKADLALIDAEHTNVAVFRDFVAARRFLGESAIIAFHDANLVFDGLLNIEQHLASIGAKFCSAFLPDSVFVIATGAFIHLAGQPLARMALDRERFVHSARVSLWREIAEHSRLIKDEVIGRRSA